MDSEPEVCAIDGEILNVSKFAMKSLLQKRKTVKS